MPTPHKPPTNEDRGRSALTGLNAYVADTRHGDEAKPVTLADLAGNHLLALELLGDLLCDLLHLADRTPLGAAAALRAGQGHHRDEVADEQ